MPEGLSATEVGQELSKHGKHAGGQSGGHHDRLISIARRRYSSRS
jgi:hypothetical protein